MEDNYLEKKIERIRELSNAENFLIIINELKALITHFKNKHLKKVLKSNKI